MKQWFSRQAKDSLPYPAVHAEVIGDQIQMRVVSFMDGTCRRAEGRRSLKEPAELGQALAAELKP